MLGITSQLWQGWVLCAKGKSLTIKGLVLLHLLLPCLRPRGARQSQTFQALPWSGEQPPSQLT